MKTKLDRAERAIESHASSFRPLTGEKLRRVERILAHARKDRSISIRLSRETLAALKRRSAREGLPYQTLISSVLHKYLTGQLVDEESIARSVRFLRPLR
jgi:predicted DNA binding CopG/RHH family protein